MGFDDNGDPTVGLTEEAVDTAEDRMDFEETTDKFLKNMEKNYWSTSLQKEAARTSNTATATGMEKTTGMKKIEEKEEEEEEILGMKTRNWRKINLSFAVELDGKDREVIRGPDQKEGSNNKMKHHPIISKIENFIVEVEKKCNTVKIMSSKKKMVLDSKACIDSWSINEVKTFLAYSIAKNRNRNIQVI
jgi:hypothetical protein